MFNVFYKYKYLIIVLVLLIVPVWKLLSVSAEPETIDDVDNKSLLENNFSDKNISKLSSNKIIIIGDSRMSLIEEQKGSLNIPKNFTFIARSGARISWTEETALPKLKELLNNKNNSYYHIVFNMGVNDLNSDTDVKTIAEDYLELYTKLISKYSKVDFYFLSVNPIDEEIIDDYFPGKRTNKKIEELNSYFAKLANKSTSDNVKYCDSYNNLDFNLPDGLHYDTKTDQKIIDYIANKCIEFK